MILVVGEALIDLVPDERGRLSPHPGGGPYTASRTLARLGADVALLTRLSGDGYGAWLRSALDADGVRPDALVATDEPTTLALVDMDAEGHAHYRYYSEGTSTAGLTVADALAATHAAAGGDVATGLSALHVGTLGLVFEPLATASEAVVTAVSDDVLVFCDPNCRPFAVRDEAAYRTRLARVIARSDVVKVSDADVEWLSPGVEPVAALRMLLTAGPAVGLLTRGGDGATIVTAGDAVDVPVPRVEVVDTIGAGDAFGGGFLAWLTRQGHGRAALHDPELVRAATDYGVRVAAMTCERAGASPPTLAELPD